MKKKILSAVVIALFIMGCAGSPTATSSRMTLDQAIREAADRIDERIEAGSKIALLNFTSSSDQFSAYVLDELTANLVDSGKLTIIDRQEIDLIRGEMNFQMSGEVSDESMQAVGRMLGAQSIVTGSLRDIDNAYRIMIRLLNVESAAVEVQYRADIANDRRVMSLLAGGTTTVSARVADNAASTGSAASGRQAATSAAPQNGTYTFFPRLQPYRGATPEAGVYIPKIVVRGDFMSIYFCADATGSTNRIARGTWAETYNRNQNIVLQNLDNPAQSYNPESGMVGAGYSWDNDGGWFTFKGVRGTRFSLTNNYDSVPSVFEEIVLGDPDE